MSRPLHDIVIAGTGVVAWLAAFALARSHGGRGGSVTLVPLPAAGPDDSLDPFGPAAPALPGCMDDLTALGLDVAVVMRAAAGGFSLGTAFTGWSGATGVGFLPFGDTGAELNGVGFQQLVWRARRAGATLRMTDFSLATLAAQMERFALPAPDTRSVLSTLDYGAHLDLAALSALARGQALAAGARLAPAPLTGVERAADGTVTALTLADGNRMAGDWFIDAGGARAVLSGPGNGWVDWRCWLPCDRVAIAAVAADGPPPPYDLHAADATGWTRRLPLRRGGWAARLGSAAHGPAADGAIAFASGRRERLWQGNVVALGAAAGILDPGGGSSLALTLSAIRRLLALYPVHPGRGAEAAEYDRQGVEAMERARDFLILRYKTNGRVGDPMWDAARAMDVPDPLAHKMAMYESRGRVPLYDGELYSRADWINLFDGQGVRAGRCDVQANALTDDAILAHLERLRAVLLRAAGAMPTHAEAMARLLGAAA